MSFLVRRACVSALAARRTLPASKRFESTAPAEATEYPDVPNVSRQQAPPKGWQDMLLRRNIGDPVHEYEELYSMWAPDVPPIAPDVALRRFSYAVAAFIAFGTFVKFALVPDMPAVRRQYPFSGLVAELGGLDENKARIEEEDTEE